ncbi:MAG: hypothetical protein HYX63_14385 [Gammaproteobacteria bacterium]|nr:hypothetical protein [Gammaproteobacteria bacterium]
MTTFVRLFTIVIAVVSGLGAALPWAAAAEAGLPRAVDTHVATRLDPTDFRSRFEIRNRYQEPQTGGFRNLFTGRLDYAFSKAFAMRFELPYVTANPRTTSAASEDGSGDLILRTSYRALRTPTFAMVAGSEFIIDTAQGHQLGAGKYTVAPIAFLSVDVPTLRSTFFPTLQYFRSVGGDPARPAVNYTTIKLFTITRWPANIYTGTEVAVYFDHERNNKVGATLEVETGRFLNQHIAIWVRPGISTHGNTIPQVYNWNLEVGFRYLFD